MTGTNVPPFHVQGHSTSSTSILVQWSSVPAADQNGVILSYTVTYTALPDGSQQTKVVSAPTTRAKRTGLNEYTNYSITVFASTAKKDGRISGLIIVVTEQDSKLTSIGKLFCGGIQTVSCNFATVLTGVRHLRFSRTVTAFSYYGSDLFPAVDMCVR